MRLRTGFHRQRACETQRSVLPPFLNPFKRPPDSRRFPSQPASICPGSENWQRRAAAAEADANVARAQLAAVELEVIEQVKRAYYELYFVERAIRITEDNRKLLLDFVKIAESRYRTGRASQQDVLRAQVEVSKLDDQLIRLRQQTDSSQARLARLLHVSPDTPVRALEQAPQQQIPHDLERLYEQAISQRPELHAQLAAVERDRRNVDLARLEYFPDLTAGVTWIGTSARRPQSRRERRGSGRLLRFLRQRAHLPQTTRRRRPRSRVPHGRHHEAIRFPSRPNCGIRQRSLHTGDQPVRTRQALS